MFKIFIILLFLSSNSYANLEKSQELLSFESEEGLKTLENSEYKQDFYQLLNFYQPQENPFYCGIASSVIILNALNYGKIESQKEIEVIAPQALGSKLLEYKLYSQKNFLNEKTDKIKSKEIIELKKPLKVENGKEIYDAGLTLAQLSDILSKVHKLKVKKIYATQNNEKSLQKFRQNVKQTLQDKTHFILVNFDGQVLQTGTRGHISPIIAYNEKSDEILVMDVALHKRKWYFVKLSKLYEAMNTKDGERFRGYIIVSK